MSKKDKCIVDYCDRDAHHTESGLCKTCYAGLYYWKGATPTRILRRHRQLKVLEARIELLTPNVRQHPAKKAK